MRLIRDIWFKLRISHVPNQMHILYLIISYPELHSFMLHDMRTENCCEKRKKESHLYDSWVVEDTCTYDSYFFPEKLYMFDMRFFVWNAHLLRKCSWYRR